jgi:hypothetical protein
MVKHFNFGPGVATMFVANREVFYRCIGPSYVRITRRMAARYLRERRAAGERIVVTVH